MCKVYWDADALKDLKRIDQNEAKKIVCKVELYLSKDPYNLGKVLSSQYRGLYRYRYGNYRIIYQIVNQKVEIIVVKIGYRSTVYKD
jgi:mRNA interferase RelE/StbE